MMPDSWRLESCADWRSARLDWMDLVREGHGIVELGISSNYGMVGSDKFVSVCDVFC